MIPPIYVKPFVKRQKNDAIRKWMTFYNHRRPHSALGGKPPAVIYWQRDEATQPDKQVQRVA